MSGLTHNIGGDIRIELTLSDGKVVDVTCHSTRPEHAARMFVGRKPAEVAARIGQVYSLCGRAQTIAALMAVEDALGVVLPAAQTAARDVLRLAEMLTQTAMRLCLSWPARLKLATQPEPVRACLMAEKTLEAALMQDGWKTPGGSALRPDLTAAQDIVQALGEAVESLLVPGGLASSLRGELVRRGLEGLGALDGGQSPEHGAFTRNFDAAPVVVTRARTGAGLAARLEAGLWDLKTQPDAMNARLTDVTDADAAEVPVRKEATGRAEVETVRGPLIHAVTLADGLYSSYEITAPTELNFDVGGTVVTGLKGVETPDHAALRLAAELHVIAIDPCVDFAVEINDA